MQENFVMIISYAINLNENWFSQQLVLTPFKIEDDELRNMAYLSKGIYSSLKFVLTVII